jgi:hypothetical protein
MTGTDEKKPLVWRRVSGSWETHFKSTELVGGDLLLEGLCPRCGHITEQRVTRGHPGGSLSGSGAGVAAAPPSRPRGSWKRVVCACGEDHPREANEADPDAKTETGCGADWSEWVQ